MPLQRRHLIAVQPSGELGTDFGLKLHLRGADHQRNIRLDGDEFLAEREVIHRGFEHLLLLGGEFTKMGVDVLHAAVFREELRCADGAYALHSRDVVRGVAAKGQYVDYLSRAVDLIFLTDFLYAEDFVIRSALAWLILEDSGLNKLTVVLIGRNHIYFEPLSRRTLRHRANHIICLETFHHQDRDTHRLHYFRERIQRIDYKLRGLGAVSFVFWVKLISEGPSRGIECHGDVCRLLSLNKFEYVFSKAEQDGGVFSFTVYHRPPEERVVHLEDERVTVYQKKFHTSFKDSETFPQITHQHIEYLYPTLDRAAPSGKDRSEDLRPLLTIIKSRAGVSARYDFVEVPS